MLLKFIHPQQSSPRNFTAQFSQTGEFTHGDTDAVGIVDECLGDGVAGGGAILLNQCNNADDGYG